MTMSTKKDGDRGFPSDSKAPPASAGSGSESKKRDDAGGETVEEQEAKLAPPDGGDKKAPVQNSASTAESPVLKSPGAEGTGATGKVGDSPAFAGEPSIAPGTFTASVDAGQDGAPVRDDVFKYVKDPGFAGERSLDAFDKDAAAPVLKSSAPAGETPPGGETKGGGPIGGAEGKGDSGSKGFPSEPQPGGGAAAGAEGKDDSGSKGFPSEPQPGGGAAAGVEGKGDSGSKGFPSEPQPGGGAAAGAEGKGDSGSKGFPSEPQPGGGATAGAEGKGDSGSKGFPSEPQPGGGAAAGAEGKDDSGSRDFPSEPQPGGGAAAGAEGKGDSSDGGGPVGAGAAAGGGGAAAGTQNGGGSSSLDVFSEKGVPDLLAPAAALDGGAKVEDSPIFGTARALSAEQPGDSLDVFAEAGSAQFGDPTSLAGGRGDLGKTADFKVEIEGIKATTPGDFATRKAASPLFEDAPGLDSGGAVGEKPGLMEDEGIFFKAGTDGNLADFDSSTSLFGEADALFGKSEAPGDVEADFDDGSDAFD